MVEVNEKVVQGNVYGYCDDEFEEVLKEFLDNFKQRSEVGASLCIRVDGRIKVDLWGGLSSVTTRSPWEKDTLSSSSPAPRRQ